MTMCPCGRPAGALVLCTACARELAKLLADVPGVLDDLDVTLARQDRTSAEPGGGKRTEQPLPFNVGASKAAEALRLTLTSWAGYLGCHTASTLVAADHLAQHVATIRGLVYGSQLLDEVHDAVRTAREIVDRHVAPVWFGLCGRLVWDNEDVLVVCPGDLRGPADEGVVVCPSCGYEHDARARRDELLDTALDRVLPAADLVRLTRAYGLPTTKGVVDGLVRRARLTTSGTHADGRPVYRVGDLLDLLAERTHP